MAFEDTNPWAAHFAAERERRQATIAKAQAKAAATRAYKANKPQIILDFENECLVKYHHAATYEDQTANGMTAFIIDYLRAKGYYAARINIGGIYMADSGKYRASGSTKGVADIIACINGRLCQFEVKAGKDRPREDQLEQQRLTREAGGIYEFVHSATEFGNILNTLQAWKPLTY